MITLQHKSNAITKFIKTLSVKQFQSYLFMKYALAFIILLIIVSCDGKSRIEKDIEAIPVDLQIRSFR